MLKYDPQGQLQDPPLVVMVPRAHSEYSKLINKTMYSSNYWR